MTGSMLPVAVHFSPFVGLLWGCSMRSMQSVLPSKNLGALLREKGRLPVSSISRAKWMGVPRWIL